MWIVYDSEEGLVYSSDDFEKAKEEYEKYKKSAKEYVQDNNEFTGDEEVILAQVKKHLYVVDTNESVIEEDEHGEEYESDVTYFDWKEE
ncbi:hypothetical protein WKH57_01505 [Niallia taxi]|uniref:hypothetical protein n=1 Tax=Niallia taxi TaxID=2499688 RepID=UPI00317B84E3